MTRAGWLVVLAAALVGAGSVVLWRAGARSEPARPGPDNSESGKSADVTLVPWGEGLPREGQWRHGFELVDFDGDGHLDVVHGPARKAGPRVPRVFLGDGAGRFREDASLAFPSLSLDYGDVAVADLDGDGALDLAVASHLQGLTVLLRRDGGFVAAPLPQEVASFSSRALAAADVDGDGRVDLIASSDGPRPFSGRKRRDTDEGGLVVLLGNAREPTVAFATGEVAAFGDSLAIGDVDGKGGVEIISASGVIGSEHLVYRRRDDGRFVLERLPGVPAGSLTRAVALVEREGEARVLVGGLVSGATGLEGTLAVIRPADGSATRLFEGAPMRAVSAVGTGDLDGDGLVDVVFGEEDGTLHVLAGTRESSAGGFVTRGTLRPNTFAGCAAYGIALADLDGRPGDEVVVSFAGEGEGCATGGGIEVYRASEQVRQPEGTSGAREK